MGVPSRTSKSERVDQPLVGSVCHFIFYYITLCVVQIACEKEAVTKRFFKVNGRICASTGLAEESATKVDGRHLRSGGQFARRNSRAGRQRRNGNTRGRRVR